jgi:integrase
LWSDLDLDGEPPTLSLTGSMKRRPDSYLYRGPVKRSTAGERTLAVPPTLAAALVAHRRGQDCERRAAGGLWMDQGQVFCAAMGTPLELSNVRKVFARVARRAGIGPVGVVPYLLCDGAVSLLVDAGAPIAEVADLLGDDPQTIYRHYRHRVQPVVTTAAERMERLLGAAGDRP